MSVGQTMRKRLLWLKEQGDKHFSISLGGVYLNNILRMDFSNPNYAKIETTVGYALAGGSIGGAGWNSMGRSVCSVFSYESIEQIISSTFNDDLTLDLSATAVAVPTSRAVTNKFLLQKLDLLVDNDRSHFHPYIGEFVSETVFKFSAADPDVFVMVIPMLGLNDQNPGLPSLKKIVADYGAFDQIHLDYDLYASRTDPTQDDTITLPWE